MHSFHTISDSTAPRTYRDRIVAIYRKHNPCKVPEVDGLLAGYQEFALYLETCIKYGVPSEPLL